MVPSENISTEISVPQRCKSEQKSLFRNYKSRKPTLPMCVNFFNGRKTHQQLNKRVNWLSRLPQRELYDIFDTCRTNFMSMIKQHHPDKGGSNAFATEIIIYWGHTKRLFARLGIGN